MLYYNMDININTLLICGILLIFGYVIDYIIELFKFKQFAKRYYDLDIHLISFTKDLIYSKLKKTL